MDVRTVRVIVRIILYGLLGLVLLTLFLPSFLPAFSGGTRGRYLRQQRHYAEAFKAGDTNVPLFAMDWFAPTVHFCRVDQSGRGSERRDVGHAIQAGVSIALNKTNLQALVESINQLPSPPRHSLPVVRQIVVGCIRSNQWFRAVYDRADIPSELEKIAEITCADLPWYVPTVRGHAVARLSAANFSGKFMCAASDAAIAISWGQSVTNGTYYFPSKIQVWNLNGSFKQVYPPLKVYSANLSWGDPAAISPDGNIVAIATVEGPYVFDLKDGKLLWKAGPLDHDGGYIGRNLAIGDGGRTLYTSGAHIIERWNLFTGQMLSVLDTNQDIVQFLKTSRNGQVLLAGFGLKYNWRPWSFAIWESNKDKPTLRFRFPDTEGAFADFSPDGKQIALTKFGDRNLLLLNWRTGEKREVPLRNSPGAYSVYWSPDEKRLAAYVDTYPASIYIYDTSTWKPIAKWDCGRPGEASSFIMQKDGTLLQILGNEINSLKVSSLERITQ